MRMVSTGSAEVSWCCWRIVSLLTMRKATKQNMKKMIFVRIFIIFSTFVGHSRKNEIGTRKKVLAVGARQSVILQLLRSKAQQEKYQT